MSEMTKMKPMPERTTCTYPEAVYLMHHNPKIATEAAAVVLACLYGRDPKTVFDHIKKGMP